MDRAVRNILIAADRLGEWEFPSDIKESLWPAVDALLAELESITGYELDIDRNVQDASFLTDIGLLDSRYYDRAKRSGAIYFIFSFRFSNFGRLFTLHGGEWEQRFGYPPPGFRQRRPLTLRATFSPQNASPM